MVKFAREIQLDTGSFAWLGAAEVQALGIFFCGMTTGDINNINVDALT
jgi:hypothetical protein